MKQVIIAIGMVVMLGFNLVADSGSPRTSKITTTVKGSQGTAGKPHIPSHQRIGAEYVKDLLILDFLQSEGECMLVIPQESAGPEQSYNFDSAYHQEIVVGELTLPCVFYIYTSLKNEYIGEINYED